MMEHGSGREICQGRQMAQKKLNRGREAWFKMRFGSGTDQWWEVDEWLRSRFLIKDLDSKFLIKNLDHLKPARASQVQLKPAPNKTQKYTWNKAKI